MTVELTFSLDADELGVCATELAGFGIEGALRSKGIECTLGSGPLPEVEEFPWFIMKIFCGNLRLLLCGV